MYILKNSSLITYIMIRRPILGAFHSIHIISSFVSMEMKMQIPSFKIRWDATQRYQFFSIEDSKIYALLSSEWRKIVVSTAVYIVAYALSVCVGCHKLQVSPKQNVGIPIAAGDLDPTIQRNVHCMHYTRNSQTFFLAPRELRNICSTINRYKTHSLILWQIACSPT